MSKTKMLVSQGTWFCSLEFLYEAASHSVVSSVTPPLSAFQVVLFENGSLSLLKFHRKP